jgi:hypothetical protein
VGGFSVSADAVTRVDRSHSLVSSGVRDVEGPQHTSVHVRRELDAIRIALGSHSCGWCATPMGDGLWIASAYIVEDDGERTVIASTARRDDRAALRALLAELFCVSGELRGAP